MKLIIVLCAVVALALAAPYGQEPKGNYKTRTHQGYFPRDNTIRLGAGRYDDSDDSDFSDSSDSSDSSDFHDDSNSNSGSDEHGNGWRRRPAPGYGGSFDYPAQKVYGSPTHKVYKDQ